MEHVEPARGFARCGALRRDAGRQLVPRDSERLLRFRRHQQRRIKQLDVKPDYREQPYITSARVGRRFSANCNSLQPPATMIQGPLRPRLCRLAQKRSIASPIVFAPRSS